jgi:hypothetical protein
MWKVPKHGSPDIPMDFREREWAFDNDVQHFHDFAEISIAQSDTVPAVEIGRVTHIPAGVVGKHYAKSRSH